MHDLLYTEEAKDAISGLSGKGKLRVRAAIERLAVDPAIGKRLTQELSHLWSYRTGDYRIIHKVEHNKLIIIILAVSHRKDIYRKTSRKIQKPAEIVT